jgi:hypothetical protein
MKKIEFLFIILFISFIVTSCEETIESNDKNDVKCNTIPNWAQPDTYSNYVYYSLFEIIAISKDQNNFIYEWAGNYYYYAKSKNINKPINIQKITNGEISYYESLDVLPCPYDNSRYILVISGYIEKNSIRTHWYLYEPESEISSKITPSDFREKGLDESTYSWLPSPFTWLNTSTEGNDLLHTRFGTYHLQKEEYEVKAINGMYYNSVSPDGKFKWSGYMLNGVKIDSVSNYTLNGNSIRWSKDSRYIASVRIIKSDDNIITYVIYVIDVEKTLAAGKVVLKRTINLRDDFCVYRAGIYAQYISENKVLVSMSENEKDKGILYEVDLNTGQRTALVSD